MAEGKSVFKLGLVFFGLLWGCTFETAQDPSGKDMNVSTLSLSVAMPADSGDSASNAVVVVSGDDMDTVEKPLNLDHEKASGEIENVPTGHRRHVEIKIHDRHHRLVCYGDAYADIRSDRLERPDITLRHVRDTSGNCGKGGDTVVVAPQNAFTADSGTVFFANYNNNLTDFVTHTDGTESNEIFAPSLFGMGLKPGPAATGKSVYRFPASNALALTSGTMEALVYADSVTGFYTHIIDKSWLYALSVYNGNLAVDFGISWWNSSVPIPLHKWSYVAASYDGSTLRLYLNGALVASVAYAYTNGDPSWQLGIGNADDDRFDIPFLGVIDEIRISRTVRTPAEITQVWGGIAAKIAAENQPEIIPTRNFAGCWNVTQYNGHVGMLHLIQTGTVLTGNMDWYTFSDSPVNGNISGDSLYYALAYPDLVPLIGYYHATLDASGNNLVNGFTESNNGNSAAWDATRTTCPVAP